MYEWHLDWRGTFLYRYKCNYVCGIGSACHLYTFIGSLYVTRMKHLIVVVYNDTHVYTHACTVIDCGEPPSLKNGDYNLANTTVNSTAVYFCLEGYHEREDTAQNEIECLSTGTWSQPSLECVPSGKSARLPHAASLVSCPFIKHTNALKSLDHLPTTAFKTDYLKCMLLILQSIPI